MSSIEFVKSYRRSNINQRCNDCPFSQLATKTQTHESRTKLTPYPNSETTQAQNDEADGVQAISYLRGQTETGKPNATNRETCRPIGWPVGGVGHRQVSPLASLDRRGCWSSVSGFASVKLARARLVERSLDVQDRRSYQRHMAQKPIMNIQPRVAGMAAFESIIHRHGGIRPRAAFSTGSGTWVRSGRKEGYLPLAKEQEYR